MGKLGALGPEPGVDPLEKPQRGHPPWPCSSLLWGCPPTARAIPGLAGDLSPGPSGKATDEREAAGQPSRTTCPAPHPARGLGSARRQDTRHSRGADIGSSVGRRSLRRSGEASNLPPGRVHAWGEGVARRDPRPAMGQKTPHPGCWLKRGRSSPRSCGSYSFLCDPGGWQDAA